MFPSLKAIRPVSKQIIYCAALDTSNDDIGNWGTQDTWVHLAYTHVVSN